ncbi:MAG: hypothetical protein A2060_00830 [Planctomycetes bacterium GWA2_50_13]|nr:MAG: hypothetical protein A2060_00830 [Planctomycetes bacterium GWA2_50_13]
MDIKRLIEEMARRDASDLYIISGAPPTLRINNRLETSEEYRKPLDSKQTLDLAFSTLSEQQRDTFVKELEMNLAISYEGIGRFRLNVFYQRNSVGMVVRQVNYKIKNFEELNLPPVLAKISMEKNGLVLIVGGAGSGKSTAMAAIIDYRSSNSGGHIITIEDPIEFIHSHKRSLITQREVGIDTQSYLLGAKHALRQSPDIIFIGEILDPEVMNIAMNFAITGHLCLSTLHAENTIHAIERVVSLFQMDMHERARILLSQNLRAIIALRLYAGSESKLIPAVEVLVGTSKVREYLRVGDMNQVRKSMASGSPDGMQTFEQSLSQLIREGRVSFADVLGAP